MSDWIKSVTRWPTNAALIADVAQLFPQLRGQVLDLTYGRGAWWAKMRPQHLAGVDLVNKGLPDHPVKDRWRVTPDLFTVADFRDLGTGMPDGTWPVVAYDPPYEPISEKQAASSTLDGFHDAYGIGARAGIPDISKPELLEQVVRDGLREAVRVCTVGGLILFKCAPYNYSATHYPAEIEHVAWALTSLPVKVAARFIMFNNGRAQPAGRRQKNALNNYSTMTVFRKTENDDDR
jgi:hypothetical protein